MFDAPLDDTVEWRRPPGSLIAKHDVARAEATARAHPGAALAAAETPRCRDGSLPTTSSELPFRAL
jgi:hypothetical protein